METNPEAYMELLKKEEEEKKRKAEEREQKAREQKTLKYKISKFFKF